MTRISFLHGAADRNRTAAAWIDRRWREGRRVVVLLADNAARDRIDSLLWSQPGTGFLPHCKTEDAVAVETPVTLAVGLDGAPDDALLLNLSDQVPAGFGRFEELFEIVSTDETDRQRGRERFRFYRDRGYQISSTDLASQEMP